MEKVSYGMYKSTASGIKKGKEALKRERSASDLLELVVNRVSAEIAVCPFAEDRSSLKVEKQVWDPPEETADLRDEVERIYRGAIHEVHREDHDLIMAVWSNHRSPYCKVCSFDFVKSWRANADLVKHVGKRIVYTRLRWWSFPDIERYKWSYNLHGMCSKPVIPQEWE